MSLKKKQKLEQELMTQIKKKRTPNFHKSQECREMLHNLPSPLTTDHCPKMDLSHSLIELEKLRLVKGDVTKTLFHIECFNSFVFIILSDIDLR